MVKIHLYLHFCVMVVNIKRGHLQIFLISLISVFSVPFEKIGVKCDCRKQNVFLLRSQAHNASLNPFLSVGPKGANTSGGHCISDLSRVKKIVTQHCQSISMALRLSILILPTHGALCDSHACRVYLYCRFSRQ